MKITIFKLLLLLLVSLSANASDYLCNMYLLDGKNYENDMLENKKDNDISVYCSNATNALLEYEKSKSYCSNNETNITDSINKVQNLINTICDSESELNKARVGEPLLVNSKIKIQRVHNGIVELNNDIKVTQKEINLIREISTKLQNLSGVDELLLNTEINKDEVEDRYFISPMDKNDSSKDDFVYGNYVQLYIGLNDKETWLRFKLKYRDDDWLFIDSFKVVADKYKFQSENYDFERDHYGGKIWEWIDIEATKNIIDLTEKINNSSKTIIRFSGKQYYSDFLVPDYQKVYLKKMLDLYKILDKNMKNKSKQKKLKR